jgi:hypothetical protein
MRNHHNLRALTQFANRVTEARHIRLIKCGVNFVEDDEWEWSHRQHAEKERHARKRALSTREEGELLATLQWWASIDLNSRSAGFAIIRKAQLRIATAEEKLEV